MNETDRGVVKYRQIPGNGRSEQDREDERDREIIKLRYMVTSP